MRILIYPGGSCDNLGDLAMLLTTVTRLQELWPTARLQVLTNEPESLKTHCPHLEPVSLRGAKRWFRVQALPAWVFPQIAPALRARFPLGLRQLWRLSGWAYPPDFRQARDFANALFGADLVVLSGCGLINDEFAFAAIKVLDIFATAIQCGIPTAMFGQGFGPIGGEQLFQRTAAVFPHLGAIHLREQRANTPLLKRLGVPAEKTMLTGDDAIEMSYKQKRDLPGTGIGINLRRASYSAINDHTMEVVREAVVKKTQQHRTHAVGIPILVRDEHSDLQTLEQLLSTSARPWNGARGAAALQQVLRNVGECRIVVTGSYHAGVFALAQGIPVVALAQSAYYLDKFHGLADQFGAGCVVLNADDPQLPAKLQAAMDQTWRDAEVLRPQLLLAAETQVAAARAAYAKLPALLG